MFEIYVRYPWVYDVTEVPYVISLSLCSTAVVAAVTGSSPATTLVMAWGLAAVGCSYDSRIYYGRQLVDPDLFSDYMMRNSYDEEALVTLSFAMMRAPCISQGAYDKLLALVEASNELSTL